MAGKSSSNNPLITNKAPDASLTVHLHPLVLLTITDYITRHTSRQQPDPIIGAVIGQQNGRNITLEHAYECKTANRDGALAMDVEWFQERLEQYKDVHKAPALDLVALFMLGSVEGPAAVHAGVIQQVQQITGTDSVMLLLFHPEMVNELQGGKLPVTLYETVQEAEGGDAALQFRELGFEVETGEAEMIGVDFVATGGGNATAVPKAEVASSVGESSTKEKQTKGKGKGKQKDGDEAETNGALSNVLSAEDEELIASLTAKVNAIKMLNSRLNLIRTYLNTLPQSYLTDATSEEPLPENTNHTLLRSINSMLSRLPLLAPPTSATAISSSTSSDSEPTTTLQAAADKEKQDVHLTSLLSSLTRSISEAQSMASRFHVLQREKTNKERSPFGGGGGRGGRGGMGFGDEGGLLTGDSGGF